MSSIKFLEHKVNLDNYLINYFTPTRISNSGIVDLGLSGEQSEYYDTDLVYNDSGTFDYNTNSRVIRIVNDTDSFRNYLIHRNIEETLIDTSITYNSTTEEYEVSNISTISNFTENEKIVLLTDEYSVNGIILRITNVNTTDDIISFVVDEDEYDQQFNDNYDLITDGYLYKLFNFSNNGLNYDNFFSIVNYSFYDMKMNFELFVEKNDSTNLDTFDSFLVLSTEKNQVTNTTDEDSLNYYISDSVFTSRESSEVGYDTFELGNIKPFIFIDSLENNSSLDFSSNYRFVYDVNINDLIASENSYRNVSIFSGDYFQNITNFGKSYVLKGISDIYKFLFSNDYRGKIDLSQSRIFVNSPTYQNFLTLYRNEDNKEVKISSENEVFFDSNDYVKKGESFGDWRVDELNFYDNEIYQGTFGFQNVSQYTFEDSSTQNVKFTNVFFRDIYQNEFNIFLDLKENNRVVIDNYDTTIRVNDTIKTNGIYNHVFVEDDTDYKVVEYENKFVEFNLFNNNYISSLNSSFIIDNNNGDPLLYSSVFDGMDMISLGYFGRYIFEDLNNSLVSVDYFGNTGVIVSNTEDVVGIGSLGVVKITSEDEIRLHSKSGIVFNGNIKGDVTIEGKLTVDLIDPPKMLQLNPIGTSDILYDSFSVSNYSNSLFVDKNNYELKWINNSGQVENVMGVAGVEYVEVGDSGDFVESDNPNTTSYYYELTEYSQLTNLFFNYVPDVDGDVGYLLIPNPEDVKDTIITLVFNDSIDSNELLLVSQANNLESDSDTYVHDIYDPENGSLYQNGNVWISNSGEFLREYRLFSDGDKWILYSGDMFGYSPTDDTGWV